MELESSRRYVSEVSPLKSPVFNELMDLLLRDKLEIAARCAAVTSAAEETPGTAATIASRTCGVRSLTGVIALTGVICVWVSVTLIVTVILSVPPFPSETDTVTE